MQEARGIHLTKYKLLLVNKENRSFSCTINFTINWLLKITQIILILEVLIFGVDYGGPDTGTSTADV